MPVALDVMAHAAAQPRRVAVRCGDRVLRYGELARNVEAAAAELRASGTTVRRLVPLTAADPIELLVGALGACLVDAVPLICDPSWTGAHRAAVLAALPSTVDVPSGAPPPAWAGFTSGSTGRPRVVLRSAVSWTGSYTAVSRLTGITADDTVLVPGPLASSLYAFAALHTLALGATLLLTPGWSPAGLRESLPGADAVHLVPRALDVAVGHLENTGGRRLRTAVVGGAALPAGLRERAAVVGVDVVAYYGATELSFVAVDTDGAGLHPFPEVEIDVRVGEVWARSPWLADGYLGDDDGGPLRRDGDGWATVGDLAEPGLPLRLRGRADGAVLTGGATVVPEDVESVLAAVPGVAGVVVIGTGHGELGSVVTAVVESRAGAAVRRATLDAAARAGLAPAQRPRRWLAIDELPRTPSGKPARTLIAAGVAAGTLSARPLT